MGEMQGRYRGNVETRVSGGRGYRVANFDMAFPHSLPALRKHVNVDQYKYRESSPNSVVLEIPPAVWQLAGTKATIMSSIELINPKAESVRRTQALQVNTVGLGCLPYGGKG